MSARREPSSESNPEGPPAVRAGQTAGRDRTDTVASLDGLEAASQGLAGTRVTH